MTRSDVAEQLLTHRDPRRGALFQIAGHPIAGLQVAGLDAWRRRPRTLAHGKVGRRGTSPAGR